MQKTKKTDENETLGKEKTATDSTSKGEKPTKKTDKGDDDDDDEDGEEESQPLSKLKEKKEEPKVPQIHGKQPLRTRKSYRRPTIAPPPSLWDDLMSRTSPAVIAGIGVCAAVAIIALYSFVIKPSRKGIARTPPALLRQQKGESNGFELGEELTREPRTF